MHSVGCDILLCYIMGGGRHFTKFLVGGSSLRWQNGPNWIWGFVKMRGQKDLRTVKQKKGVNKIENEGEHWYKMVKR